MSALALAAMLAAQGVDATPHALSSRTLGATAPLPAVPPGLTAGTMPDRLAFDEPGDGRIWAVGATYKASFGSAGFVYVPFFGSAAPRNYPVQFVLRAVRVGGHDLALAHDAAPVREGSRVTFQRGPVREAYDLTARSVEQTFVVDGALPGDVEVEMEVMTDLVEDPAETGIQFANALGAVCYGTAYVVHGAGKTEIPSVVAGNRVTLRVPAAQRGVGPVVIDPIVRTRSLNATLMVSDIPDVAYDTTTDRWAVTWVHVFSAADHDVVAELRTSAGEAIAGTFHTIDPTTMSHSWPRIANLNSADRFLIAMERFVPQATPPYTVWGRTMAAATSGLGTLTEISPPSNAEQRSVDVGGDPGSGTLWTVVWRHGSDIHARQVDASGTPRANTIPIEVTSAACINPQISLSNGNGQTATPAWCIVYSLAAAADNWDVYGAVLDPNGSIVKAHSPIAATQSNDLYTYVSSPLVDERAGPAFVVSFERQGATPELLVKIVDRDLATVVQDTNLTRRFGFSGVYGRVESDGCRFVATCQINNTLRAGTVSILGNDLVLHESLQSFGTGAGPNLAAKRSGGGGRTDYAVVYADSGWTPQRIEIGIYEGRAPNGDFDWRDTGCGLEISPTGRPILGETIRIDLLNAGNEVAALFLGLPATAMQVCPTCSIGIDLSRVLVPFASPMILPLPASPRLVGTALAVQGFAVGSGTCLGTMRMTDTIDFTIQ